MAKGKCQVRITCFVASCASQRLTAASLFEDSLHRCRMHEAMAFVSSCPRSFSSMLFRLGDTHVLVAQPLVIELRVAA